MNDPNAPVTPFGSRLIQELVAKGIIPARCTRWELVSDVEDVLRIRSEVLASRAEFETVAKLLLENEDEARRFVRDVILKSPFLPDHPPFTVTDIK